MADEQEKKEASDKHYDSMRRLENLKGDVGRLITDDIRYYYDRVPSDLIYEKEERQHIRNSLQRIQRRIDETINSL